MTAIHLATSLSKWSVIFCNHSLVFFDNKLKWILHKMIAIHLAESLGKWSLVFCDHSLAFFDCKLKWILHFDFLI